MKLHDKAAQCARLGAVSGKAAADLDEMLQKWFVKHFVKGLTLPVLKSLNGTEGLTAFENILSAVPDHELLAVVRKLDAHRPELLALTRNEILVHIRAMAQGQISPAEKPKKQTKKKATSSKNATKGGILAQSRQ